MNSNVNNLDKEFFPITKVGKYYVFTNSFSRTEQNVYTSLKSVQFVNFFTKIWFDTAAADILIDMERQTKTNFHSIDRTVRTATHSTFIQDQYHAKSEVFLCTYFAFYEFGSFAICKYNLKATIHI